MQVIDPYNRRLLQHQKKALKFIKNRKIRAGIFMEPGTGKTTVGIKVALQINPAIVICRPDDFLTWFLEFAYCGVHKSNIFQIRSSKDIESKDLKNTRYKFVFCTYDLLTSTRVSSWVKSYGFQLAIADESDLIAHYKTARTQAVLAVVERIPGRLALTGTPILNRLDTIFAQSWFIDDGEAFGRNWWAFMSRYFQRVQNAGWYPRSTSKEQIGKKLAKIAFSVEADKVLDLPPLRSIVKGVPMTKQQEWAYHLCLKNWELPKNIELNEVTTQLIKLRQIASGFYYDPNKKVHWLPEKKTEAIFKEIKEKGFKKVVVYCCMKPEILKVYRAAKEAGYGVAVLYGTAEQRNKARRRFATKNNCNIFICQVDRAVGMNELVVANVCMYYNNSVRVRSRIQSLARVRRKGSEIHSEILCYDFCSEDTIDVTILNSLRQKRDLAQAVLTLVRQGVRSKSIKKFVCSQSIV